MEKKIRKLLDEIRPMLQEDGGDIEFVSFSEKDNKLVVKLEGACSGCPMARVTLKEGVEKFMREKTGRDINVENVI